MKEENNCKHIWRDEKEFEFLRYINKDWLFRTECYGKKLVQRCDYCNKVQTVEIA